MPRAYLTRHLLGVQPELPITDDQFRAAEQADLALDLVLATEERFDFVARSLLEFEGDMLNSLLETAFVGFGQGMEQMAVRRLLNRRLASLLSAARAYIDFSRHAARALLPPPSAEEVLASFSRHYDASLGYRALEALRNYSQHRGMPIHGVRYRTQVMHEQPGHPIKETLAPLLDTARLREDGEFKSTVLVQLEALGPLVNLKPLVRDYVAALAKTHELLRVHSQAVSVEATATLDALRALFQDQYGANHSHALVARRVEGESVRTVRLSTDNAQYAELMSKSNVHFMHLGVAFVSGEPDSDA